ncbi:hypothetical protein VCHENC02_5271, partial [Vibrio harveyi]
MTSLRHQSLFRYVQQYGTDRLLKGFL